MRRELVFLGSLLLASACATPLKQTDSVSSAEKELLTVESTDVVVPREFLQKILDNDRSLQQQNRDLKAQLEAIRAVDLGQAPVKAPARKPSNKKKRNS